MLAGTDAATAAAITGREQLFLAYMQELLAMDQRLLLLVDKQHALGADHVPPDLVAVDDYRITTNRAGHQLSRAVVPDLLAMVETARGAGLELMVSSAYRSYDYQDDLFQRYVREIGAAEAARVSARAGQSQHQLGTTIDFGSIADGYGATANGRWMADNAWRFGFSLSYPDGLELVTGYRYEPWHFRYLGRTATRVEREFFSGTQQLMLEFYAAHAGWFRARQVAAPAASS